MTWDEFQSRALALLKEREPYGSIRINPDPQFRAAMEVLLDHVNTVEKQVVRRGDLRGHLAGLAMQKMLDVTLSAAENANLSGDESRRVVAIASVALADAVIEALELPDLNTATGAELDRTGKFHFCERIESETDSDYRARIASQRASF